MSLDISKDASSLTIIKCTFTEVIDYHSADEIIKQGTKILLVNMQKDLTFALTINESCFIRNSKIKLLTVNDLPEMSNDHVSVILRRGVTRVDRTGGQV